MGKPSSSSAPAPDPKIGEAALKQAETGEDWLTFARDAFKISTSRQTSLDKLTKRVTEQQLGLADLQASWAKKDRARYDKVFKPVENSFIRQAKNYATRARQRQAAAEARSDVQRAAATQRQIAERDAAALGINPASGRYAGIRAEQDLDTALASAGAENNARQMVRDKGLALKADVVNLGRGLPAQAAAGSAGSVAAGGTALSGTQASNSQFLASTGIMSGGFGGAMQGYAGQASTLNQQYGLQLDGWKTEQQIAAQNAAGMGSFLGGIGGLIFSDEELKENKEELPEGAALDAVREMPVEEWDYKPGVADEGRHVGTYAQDFQRETGRGDGKTIPVQDAIGITMAAVKDLDRKVDELGASIGLAGVGERRKKRNVDRPPPQDERAYAV
ncbi:tail fiber domain-containing protein [Shinella pollutisoli]|uniref:Tail fiber domain-containing protein n=1 Tax=Shinella pollutisoli TaxID=2250594 RepID=A0ABV7DJ26_9HYPH|nr:tail fiber domain-containing protein [Shinella pollutisoli]